MLTHSQKCHETDGGTLNIVGPNELRRRLQEEIANCHRLRARLESLRQKRSLFRKWKIIEQRLETNRLIARSERRQRAIQKKLQGSEVAFAHAPLAHQQQTLEVHHHPFPGRTVE